MSLRSFQKRPITYKASTVLTLIAGMLMVVGVASPYWHQSEKGSTFGGLWSRCVDGASSSSSSLKCVDRTADISEGWWVWIQVLTTVGLVCVVLCCSALLFENIFSDVTAPCLLQETMGLVGGLVALIGCIIFVVKTEPLSDDSYAEYSWSFYFDIVGGVIVFVASGIILVGGKTTHKSLRLAGTDGQISPEPVRRFSHLWARESPATPEGARRTLGSAGPRDPTTSSPALSKGLIPACETKASDQHPATATEVDETS